MKLLVRQALVNYIPQNKITVKVVMIVEQQTSTINNTQNKNFESLGGWLILLGIGIVLWSIWKTYLLYTFSVSTFTEGRWEVLVTLSAENGIPYLTPLTFGKLIAEVLLLFADIYLIYLYFAKKKAFPTCYIVLSLLLLVFILVDAWITTLVLPDKPMFDVQTVRNLTRSFMSCLIWIPYMLVSKRVKATFLH